MSNRWNEKKSYKYKRGTKDEQVTTLGDGNILMRANYLLSSKPLMAIIGIVVFFLMFFLINYFINSCLNVFSNFSGIFSGTGKELMAFKNAFLFVPGRSFLYAFNLMFSSGFVASILFKIRIAYKDLNVGQKGVERFTEPEEIKEQYKCIDEKDTPFEGEGGIAVYRDGNKIYIDDSPTNTYVNGTTRSGKGELSIRVAIENISRSSCRASMIITDPKLEQYPACKESLEKRGYKVYLLNLLEPIRGNRCNPLALIITAYKQGDYDEAELLCNTLAHSYYDTDSKNTGEAGEFFINTSSDCLSAMILAVTEDCLKADKIQNAKDLLKWKRKQRLFKALSEEEQKKFCQSVAKETSPDWLNMPYIPDTLAFVPTHQNEKKINLYSIIHTFTSLVRIITNEKTGKTGLDEYFQRRSEFDRAKKKYASVEVAGTRTKGNVFSSALSKLTVFTYEGNAKMTSGNDIDILDIGFGDQPVAFFLGIPDFDPSNHFIASAMIHQIYFALSKEASRYPGGSLKRRVHFFLDEVGNMPKINNLKTQLTMGLGRGLVYHLYVQSDEQLHDIYGDTAKTIMDNCGNQIYIKSVSPDTSENFSKALGSRTVTTINRMGGKFSLHKTYQENHEERRLLNANELMNLQIGEFAMRRLMKRTDLKGNKIVATPIFCHGEHSFQYAHEYLGDFFKTGKTYRDYETGSREYESIYDNCYDVTRWINENLNESVAFPDTELFPLVNLRGYQTLCEKLQVWLNPSEYENSNQIDITIQLMELYEKRKIEEAALNELLELLGGGT